MSHHAPALADIRSDFSRRNRSLTPRRPLRAAVLAAEPQVSFASRPTLRTCPEGNRRRIVAPAARAGWVGDKFPATQLLIRLSATPQVSGHKIAKTTPCKVEWALARSTQAACVRVTRWSVVTAPPTHPAPKPRDGAGQRRLSCVANGESGRVPHQCNAASGAAFNAATDQARPAEARTAAPRECNASLIHGRGAVNGESCYEARPRLPAVTTVSHSSRGQPSDT